MTQTTMTPSAPAPSMRLQAAWLRHPADCLAVATAASLPWSTSATSILVGLWLLAIVPTLSLAGLKRVLAMPAASLPIVLLLLVAVGMLWADVRWAERFDGISAFLKLAVIPILIVQFRQSDRGRHVLAGFLSSSTLLLLLSWILVLLDPIDPNFVWQPKQFGIPVKDYISQSAIFAICAFALLDQALTVWSEGRRRLAVTALILALLFLANIVFVATSRTTLAIIPVLLVLWGLLRLGPKRTIVLLTASCVLVAIAWVSSPYLRFRVLHLVEEVQQQYRDPTVETSAGDRIAFWTMSMAAIREAPVFGHGTGSIGESFRRLGSATAVNPHNQIFAVGIQLGLVGILVLIAMWAAHVRLFFDSLHVAWPGLVVVTQNIVGSLFNSHLSDFTHGWIYVFGVGVVGGMLLRIRTVDGWTDPVL